jgi:hypothetical protein
MSQYPITTTKGIYQAVNYLASGPSGLGQNFQGFSDYTTVYLTGNYRLPFTQANTANIYVANVQCSSATAINGNTFQFNFASVQSTPPFALGAPITSIGFSNVDNDFWNGSWAPIGVVSCSTSNVIVRTNQTYANVPSVTTGNVQYDSTDTLISTDCNARVTVQGGTDTVFISAQLTDIISYIGSGNLTYTVDVNRYVGFTNNDPTNPDYLFTFDATVSQKIYTYSNLTGPGTLDEVETIFATVLDQPSPNYYWYIVEVEFDVDNTLQIQQSELGLRSLTAQVMKQ